MVRPSPCVFRWLEMHRRVERDDQAIRVARRGRRRRDDAAGRVPDQHTRSGGTKAGVERGHQLALEEIEKAIAAFAAAACRKTGRSEVAHALRITADVLDAGDDRLGRKPIRAEFAARLHDGGGRVSFAVSGEDERIAAVRAGGGERGRRRHEDPSRLAKDRRLDGEVLPRIRGGGERPHFSLPSLQTGLGRLPSKLPNRLAGAPLA
ncbi:MAG: hypothetical protein M3R55_08685 [Acidobacteriota bacterium]|nr:hypothetical protein [Acidobacteriota bacterium]